MEIKVLGTGCSKCKSLYAIVQEVVNELNINAQIVKEEDIVEIMKYNTMMLPALAVDDKVVGKGSMKTEEVRKLIQNFVDNQ